MWQFDSNELFDLGLFSIKFQVSTFMENNILLLIVN